MKDSNILIIKEFYFNFREEKFSFSLTRNILYYKNNFQ